MLKLIILLINILYFIYHILIFQFKQMKFVQQIKVKISIIKCILCLNCNDIIL